MESGRRSALELRHLANLLRKPHEVFDSRLTTARQEWMSVRELLLKKQKLQDKREVRGAEAHVSDETGPRASPIEIFWEESEGFDPHLLRLTPVEEDGAVFGYRGSYGPAMKEEDGRYIFLDEKNEGQPLEKIFGVPNNESLLIRPTVSRWAMAVEPEPLDRGILRDNERVMYIGLGMILKNPRALFISMHEAGHLVHPDEKEAWRYAARHNKKMHSDLKEDVVAGRHVGMFQHLRRPQKEDDLLTRAQNDGEGLAAGDFIRLGLVSHYVNTGDVEIPARWKTDSALEQASEAMTALIQSAHANFRHFFSPR